MFGTLRDTVLALCGTVRWHIFGTVWYSRWHCCFEYVELKFKVYSLTGRGGKRYNGAVNLR